MPRPNVRPKVPFSRGSIPLGTYASIPLRAHWTLLLVLPLFAYVMAVQFFGDGGPFRPAALLGGALLALVLFASITIHEFAHSLVAQRSGVPVSAITLLPIGGISHFEELPERGGHELRISLVGPVSNFVLALLFFAAALVAAPAVSPDVASFLRGAWVLNLALGAFNLFFPAFPMDGGRILRALLSRRLPYLRATAIAARVGRGLAVVLGILGFLALPGGAWLLLIAFFIYTGADAEERTVRLTALLEGMRVADIMTQRPVTVRPEATVEEALDLMLQTKHVALPVVDGKRLVGVFTLDQAAATPTSQRARAAVGPLVADQPITVGPQAELTEALPLLRRSQPAPLAVVEGDELLGVLSETDLGRAVTILASVGPETARRLHARNGSSALRKRAPLRRAPRSA